MVLGEAAGCVLAVSARAVLAVALWAACAEDLARRIVPNGCVLAVLLAAVAEAAARGLLVEPLPRSFGRAAAGAATGLLVMLLTAWASARRRGSAGVGGGDVKLVAAAGAWVGPWGALLLVAASCLLAVAAWGLFRLVGGLVGRFVRAGSPPLAGDALPFAPSIAACLVAAAFLSPVLGAAA